MRGGALVKEPLPSKITTDNFDEWHQNMHTRNKFSVSSQIIKKAKVTPKFGQTRATVGSVLLWVRYC